jgi:hypothetical protein
LFPAYCQSRSWKEVSGLVPKEIGKSENFIKVFFLPSDIGLEMASGGHQLPAGKATGACIKSRQRNMDVVSVKMAPKGSLTERVYYGNSN